MVHLARKNQKSSNLFSATRDQAKVGIELNSWNRCQPPQYRLTALAEKSAVGKPVFLPPEHDVIALWLAQQMPLISTLFQSKSADGIKSGLF